MRKVFVACFLVLLSVAYASPSKACGGGAPFFIQDFDNRDIIVHARVLDVDSRGYNAILRVDRYFKGAGGEYLAVMRYSPALEVVAAVRDYDTSCTYSGGGEAWFSGSEGYFALSDNGNGTYTDNASQGSGAPHFFVQEGRVEFYSFDVYTDAEPQLSSLPTNEFEALLLKYGDRDKAIEPIPNRYPLMRFLTITTESGQRYQLNPDRSVLPLDPETSPLAISNDGSHILFRIDDDHLGFQYLSLIRQTEEYRDAGRLIPQVGRSALFSPDSNFVAVQEAKRLTIYMFENYERGGYGQHMTMQVVASKNLSWPTTSPSIAWSADSSTIAYQDEEGIWVWNIFEASEPHLAVSRAGKFTLTDLSTSGRYVSYDSAETRMLLDVQTGEIFENAIATPDESNLIYIRSEYSEGTPDINRHGDRECQAPLAKSCPIYLLVNGSYKFFWYKNHQIAFWSCGEEACYVGSFPWQLSIASTYNYESQLDTPLPIVSALDYDIRYDQPVVAVNDYTLEFGFYPNWERDEPSDPPLNINSVDLSDQLDSPIVTLEWGQPIFYELNQ